MDVFRPHLAWRAMAAFQAVAVPVVVLSGSGELGPGLGLLAWAAFTLLQRMEREGSVLQRRIGLSGNRIDLSRLEHVSVRRAGRVPLFRVLVLSEATRSLSLWLLWWSWRPLVEVVRPHVVEVDAGDRAQWLVATDGDREVAALFGH